MKFAIAYEYDNISKEYKYQVRVQQNPRLPGTYFLPPNTVLEKPLEYKVKKAVVWDQENKKWKYIDDHRGQLLYNKQDSRNIIVIDKLNYDIPKDYISTAPPDRQKWYKYKNKKWVYYFQPIKKDSLYEITYKKKCQVAYTGIYIIKDNIKYLFQTSQDSITMCNSTKIMLESKPDQYQLTWKTWVDNQPSILILTKVQFNHVFQLGLEMINTSFQVQGILNIQIANMTDQQLADETKMTEFKNKIQTQFNKIPKEFQINTL